LRVAVKKIFRVVLPFLGRMRFLRFGVRDRIIRFLDNPSMAENESFEVPFFGMIYSGKFSSYIDWNVYYYGAYAREELQLYSDMIELSATKVFLDIGANVGHHSLFVCALVQEVHAFEPFPEFVKQIEARKVQNQVENIYVHGIALGELDETICYNPPDSCNLGTGNFLHTRGGVDQIMLPVRNGDSFLDENEIGDVGFVKIDVEGFGVKVLRGLKDTLEKYRPVVYVEWSINEIRDAPEDPRLLFPEGYIFFNFSPDVTFGIFRKLKYGLFEISNEWPECDILAIPDTLKI